MAVQADILDVILRIQNLRSFQAGMRTAAADVKAVGTAAKETNMANASMSKGTGALMMVSKAAKWGAVSLAAMAVEAYKLGTNFDSQMTRVETMAGASASEVARLRGEVLGLAGPTGQAPQELAAALYHIESVGLRGAKALDAVHAAADGAAMGGAGLEETATALGAVLRVHIKGAADSARGAMSQLAAIAGAGNMTMEDLVHALGTGILPAAKAAGLSLSSVGSAIALLTDEGYPASSGAAQLGTALHFLYAPTNKARDALADLGLSQRDLVAEMSGPKGLMGALQLLETHLQSYSKGDRAKYLEQLGNILPGGRGRVLILLMNQLENYQRKLNQVQGTSSQFEAHLIKTHETAKFRLHAAWASIQADLIKLQDTFKGPVTAALVGIMHLFGYLVRVLTQLPAAISAVIKWWGQLPGPLKIVAEGLAILTAEVTLWKGAVAGVAIVNGLAAASYAFLAGAAETAAIAMLIALDNPIMLAIVALIMVIVLLVTHWKQVKHAAIDAWHWTEQAARDALHWIEGAVKNVMAFIHKHWRGLLEILTGPFGIAVVFIADHFQAIKHTVQSVIHWITNALHNVLKFAESIPGRIKRGVEHLPSAALHAAESLLPHFAQGGISMGGPAWVGERGPEMINLPRGASVIPTGQSYFESRRHVPNPAPAGGGGAAQVIEHHSHIYIGRREVAHEVNRFNADQKARG